MLITSVTTLKVRVTSKIPRRRSQTTEHPTFFSNFIVSRRQELNEINGLEYFGYLYETDHVLIYPPNTRLQSATHVLLISSKPQGKITSDGTETRVIVP